MSVVIAIVVAVVVAVVVVTVAITIAVTVEVAISAVSVCYLFFLLKKHYHYQCQKVLYFFFCY